MSTKIYLTTHLCIKLNTNNRYLKKILNRTHRILNTTNFHSFKQDYFDKKYSKNILLDQLGKIIDFIFNNYSGSVT